MFAELVLTLLYERWQSMMERKRKEQLAAKLQGVEHEIAKTQKKEAKVLFR